MAFTSRFSTAPAQSTPWHNTNNATNLSVRHIWPPSDVSIDDAPGDTISALEFAPQKQNVAGFGPCEVLACASWDNQVRLYVVTPILVNPNNPADNNNTNKDMLDTRFEIEKEFPFNFKHGEPAKLDTKAWKAYSHDQPVLAISFDSAGTNLYSGGCDGKVYQYNIHTEQKVEVPVPHQAPVKLVKVFRAPNGHEWLLTAAWDRTYQFRNLSDGSTFPQFPPVPGAGQALLPNRPVAVDANSKIIVIAMSERMVRTYNLSLPNWIQQPDDRLSQLRWQTRSIACFTDEAAYAIGSIEGRIAITYPLDQRMRDGRSVNDTSLPPDRSYSFKCHRQDLKAEIHNPECEQGAQGTVPRGSSNNTSSNNKPQHIFPVNVLCFNKSTKGSFVSGGGDGSLTYWDGLRRSKLRNYWPQDYELPSQPSYLCWTQIETRNDKPKKYTGDYKPYIEAQIAQERAPNPSERQYAAELIARKKPYDDKAAQFGGLRLGLPVCAYAYNSDQTVGAFGVSYDWSKGHAYAPLVDAQGQKDPSTAPRLYLHMQLSVDVTKLEA